MAFEMKTAGQFYQNQVAATLAALLGLSYTNAPAPGAVLAPVLRAPNYSGQ